MIWTYHLYASIIWNTPQKPRGIVIANLDTHTVCYIQHPFGLLFSFQRLCLPRQAALTVLKVLALTILAAAECHPGLPGSTNWHQKIDINWKFQKKNGFYCHQIMSHLSKAKIAPMVYGQCAYWTKPGTKFHPAQRFFPGIDLIEREKSRLKSISGRRYSLLSISNITRKGGVKLEKPET